MRARITVIATAVSLLVSSSPAFAIQAAQQPQHIADAAALRRAIETQTARDDANRQSVREALRRDDVREAARALGLNVKAAEDALATMTSDELARVAAPARAVTTDRTGAASTVTISITTLLLLLILIVLIVK
jgi:hypothetical protein